MHAYYVDETVRLVPTEGGHQKTFDGKVSKVTPARITVTFEAKPWGIAFRRTDGLPAFKCDRGFPCYRVEPIVKRTPTEAAGRAAAEAKKDLSMTPAAVARAAGAALEEALPLGYRSGDSQP